MSMQLSSMNQKTSPASQSPTAQEQDTAELLMPVGIVVVSFCLAFGVLVGVLVLPVQWLPGQLLLLIAMLVVVPAVVTVTTQRLAQLSGLAASSYRGRTRWALLAGILLALVALPAYEWRALHPTIDVLNSTFVAPVAVSLVMIILQAGIARDLTAAWLLLHRQVWENTERLGRPGLDVETERTDRVNRTVLIQKAWRWWGIGGVVIALALFLGGTFSAGQFDLVFPWGLLTFVVYAVVGLLGLGHAVHTRWDTEWRLERLSVATEVDSGWGPLALTMTIIAVVGASLVMLFHLLDLGHAVALWLAATLLWPLLALLDHLFSGLGAGGAQQHTFQNLGRSLGLSPAKIKNPPPPGHTTPPGWWIWLLQAWPYLLGIVALVIIAWSYIQARRAGRTSGSWWVILRAMARELQKALLAFWRPAHQLMGQALGEARRAVGQSVRGGRRLRLSELGPREAVIALYGLMLEQVARRGYPRQTGQTPHEYAASVARQAPQTTEALTSMTETFVAVRYGGRPADQGVVTRLQDLLAVLRQALRGQRSR